MKRYTNLFKQIVDINNIYIAEKNARKNKQHRKEIIQFDKNKEQLLLNLQQLLISGKYKTSEYHTFTIYEPKERIIYRLPYYPDRIVHHAIVNVLSSIWVSNFTKDTYSCIKGRGIHKAAHNVKTALKDNTNTQYCLKLDIQKFYPSIDNSILKQIIRKKIKDKKVLQLLDEIIDSTKGIPIGNYLSQFFANLYLSGFDHWIKEIKRVKYYFRYMDDIVLLDSNKSGLHQLRIDIQDYLQNNLHLQIKDNWQVFPVDSRGIDFVGYKFFHNYTLLRKGIKKKFCKVTNKLNKLDITEQQYKQKVCSYLGWLKHCNAYNLANKQIKYKPLLDILKV